MFSEASYISNATSIMAATPAYVSGALAKDVVVNSTAGTATLTGGFTYTASAPALASIAPNTGSTAGGTSVTITDTNFTGATAVTIGGAAAMGVSVIGATTISAVTLAHGAGVVDVVVTTPGGSGTGSGLYTYAVPATTTAVASSKNPSQVGQSVTFIATVSSKADTPSGTVVFNDGGTALGTAALAGGVASLTTSALTLGTNAITAAFTGNSSFSGSTSPALQQAVSTPQDSLNLRALQIAATRTIAQNSGAAISGAIDTAISDGFSGGGSFMTLSAGGVRFNFSADPDQSASPSSGPTMSNTIGDRATAMSGNDQSGRGRSSGDKSRVDDAFVAIDRAADQGGATARERATGLAVLG